MPCNATFALCSRGVGLATQVHAGRGIYKINFVPGIQIQQVPPQFRLNISCG